jgi:hypothetical protein
MPRIPWAYWDLVFVAAVWWFNSRDRLAALRFSIAGPSGDAPVTDKQTASLLRVAWEGAERQAGSSQETSHACPIRLIHPSSSSITSELWFVRPHPTCCYLDSGLGPLYVSLLRKAQILPLSSFPLESASSRPHQQNSHMKLNLYFGEEILAPRP